MDGMDGATGATGMAGMNADPADVVSMVWQAIAGSSIKAHLVAGFGSAGPHDGRGSSTPLSVQRLRRMASMTPPLWLTLTALAHRYRFAPPR